MRRLVFDGASVLIAGGNCRDNLLVVDPGKLGSVGGRLQPAPDGRRADGPAGERGRTARRASVGRRPVAMMALHMAAAAQRRRSSSSSGGGSGSGSSSSSSSSQHSSSSSSGSGSVSSRFLVAWAERGALCPDAKNRVKSCKLSVSAKIFLACGALVGRLRRAGSHLISDPSHVHVWYGPSLAWVRQPSRPPSGAGWTARTA